MAIPKELSDKIQQALDFRWIYVLIDDVVYCMEIIHASWIRNDIVVRHKEGWIYVINPYEYGETWSLNKKDLIKGGSPDDSNR